MLAANFGCLDREVQMVNESAADWFHLDIMDGVFVPNISYGFPVVEAIAKKATKPLDAHLMVVNPDAYVERFQKLGISYLSLHYEACPHLHRSLRHIRNAGMKAGVALNPHVPVSLLSEVLEDADFILLMSVNPGFGGQAFIPNTLHKVALLKEMILKKQSACLIEVDGGIHAGNAPALMAAGADVLVAGNALFASEHPLEAIQQFKKF